MAKRPLYEGDDVKQIIIRDDSGRAMIVIVNMYGNTWSISYSTDSDWKVLLERYGVQEKIQPN